MRYMGGKFRKGKIIAQYIQPHIDRVYLEPFVGMCGVMRHIDAPCRIGSDLNPYTIAVLQALQNGWEPPTSVSEAMYNVIKDKPDLFNPALVGFVGFGCSFGAKFFGGYARDSGGARLR